MSQILYYLKFPFVQYAVIVGILISLCAALLGVVLVLRRFSFIGDGLSHVAFGAMAVAAVTGVTNNMAVVLPITVVAAVLLLCTGQGSKIKGDASIALMSVSALAIGYLLMNLFPASSNVAGDVCSSLFGSASILTLSQDDVMLCIGLSVVVITVFIVFYNKIFAITFDESFSKTAGVRVGLYNLLFSVVIALTVVLAMRLVGSLLISALVIFPALSAMRVCRNFKALTLCAAAISVVNSAVGMLTSIVISTPVGSTVVAVSIITFALFTVIGKIKKG